MGLFSWLTGKTAKTDPETLDEANDEAESEEALPATSTAQLVAALSSRDAGMRVDASRALLERWRGGVAEAAAAIAPLLPALLEDAEPLVRVNALAGVRLLRKAENQEKCQSATLALLNDPVAQVRTAAVATAARLPGEVARAQVRALLVSPEEPMRFQAATVLADLQDSAALPALIAALHEEIRRQEALSALMSLGDAGALPAVAAIFDDESTGEFDRTMAAAALARLGDERGGEHLAARIAERGDDAPVAAEMAGRLRVAVAIPALTELAEDEGAPARGAALRALGRLQAEGAEARLLALAGSAATEEDLRMDAAEGLAELATPAACAMLESLAGKAGGELGTLCRELLFEVAANEPQAPAGATAVKGQG